MPRPKRTSGKKAPSSDVSDNENMSGGSDSDFDDDEDPDKIEVPGGGKDLATAASISSLKEESKDIKPKIEDSQAPILGSNATSQLPSKIPGGLVTKANSSLGYEKVRVGASQGQAPFPFGGPAGIFGGMGFFPGMGGMPSGLTPSFLQQTMDLGGMNPMAAAAAAAGLGPGFLQHMNMNPYLMQQNGGNAAFLSQLLGPAMHQGWAGGLSGKTVSQLWMGDEAK